MKITVWHGVGTAVSWNGYKKLFVKKSWVDMGVRLFILTDANGMECGVGVPQDEITVL